MTFHPLKEEFAVLATQGGAAKPFRLLGLIIYEKLLMNECIDKLYRKAKPKVRAKLRCKRYYHSEDFLLLFKSHERRQIECCNKAIYHAAKLKLAWLDIVQT